MQSQMLTHTQHTQHTRQNTHILCVQVTLLGQNIDAYGRDLPGMASDGSGRRMWTFTDLLRYVHDVPGIERIRFATSHPRYFTGGAICAWRPLQNVAMKAHTHVRAVFLLMLCAQRCCI